jgi:hypothetical protein
LVVCLRQETADYWEKHTQQLQLLVMEHYISPPAVVPQARRVSSWTKSNIEDMLLYGRVALQSSDGELTPN